MEYPILQWHISFIKNR